jgi:hypothetical protein
MLAANVVQRSFVQCLEHIQRQWPATLCQWLQLTDSSQTAQKQLKAAHLPDDAQLADMLSNGAAGVTAMSPLFGSGAQL